MQTVPGSPAPPATPGAPPTFGAGPVSGPPVSSSTFAEAEKLVQVTMSPAERDMAAASWPRSLAPLLERRVGPRKIALEPELAPATQWNPSLAGEKPGPTQDRFVRSAGDAIPLPANDADVAFAPVTQLSRWIEQKKLTSERLTEHLSSAHRAVRSETALRHHAAQRAGDRASAQGRRGDRGGEVSRAFARDPFWREGSARYGGHRDDVRRRAVPEQGADRRLRGGPSTDRGGRRPHREAEPGRARAQRHLVRRTDHEPVAPRGGRVGIERRSRRRDRGCSRRLFDWQRNRRQHRLAFDALRRDGTSADVRPRAPDGRDDALLVARQARPDDPQRGGRDARAAGRQRARRGRRVERAEPPRVRRRRHRERIARRLLSGVDEGEPRNRCGPCGARNGQDARDGRLRSHAS